MTIDQSCQLIVCTSPKNTHRALHATQSASLPIYILLDVTRSIPELMHSPIWAQHQIPFSMPSISWGTRHLHPNPYI